MRRVVLVKSMKATGVPLFSRPDDGDSPTFAKIARSKGRLGYGDAKYKDEDRRSVLKHFRRFLK